MSNAVVKAKRGPRAAFEFVLTNADESFLWRMDDYPWERNVWNFHPEVEIHLVRNAAGILMVGDHLGEFHPGELTVVGSNLPHDWVTPVRPGELIKGRDIVIQFLPEKLSEASRYLPELAGCDEFLRKARRGLSFHSATRERANAIIESMSEMAGLSRLAAFLQLLSVLRESDEYRVLSSQEYSPNLEYGSLDVLQRVFAFILENIRDDIRLQDVADIAKMSESSFSRFFKKNSGNNFTEHVNRLRTWKAAQLLLESSLPVTEICFEVGYLNISNFNRTFMRHYKMSPSAYRKMAHHRRHAPNGLLLAFVKEILTKIQTVCCKSRKKVQVSFVWRGRAPPPAGIACLHRTKSMSVIRSGRERLNTWEVKMKLRKLIASTCLAWAGATMAAGFVSAETLSCTAPIKVLAQPRDGLSLLELNTEEFKQLSGTTFEIDYLNENDRRAKSKADASTVGNYNVYYVDEANVALFAASGWIVPLMDYYPAEYDFADFDPGRQKVATFDGKPWFAPLTGGGDLLVYRKDLLEAKGIKPPTTLDELFAAAEQLNDPDNGVYGIALRGGRGSGANVWRWMPYFKAHGGQWFDGDKPVFNSDAAVKATEDYLKLFAFSPPGTETGSWDQSVGAFLSGQVALLVESTPLAGMSVDPNNSMVVGKVGFMPPPSPLTGGGYGHGLAIASKANADGLSKKCAGLFIAWATSKENEKRRLEAKQFGELNRTSILSSKEFADIYGADLGKALADTGKVTAVNFWQDRRWPELGDRWGIILEELINGTRTDVKGGLDELEAFAVELAKK